MQTKWAIIRTGLLSFSCVVAVHAQSITTQTSSTAGDRATITGCVERAEQLSQATPAQTTDPDSMSFVLIHAARGTTGQPQIVGTSGSANDAMKGDTYRLDGAVPMLNPHVGHKVEVTGVVSAAAPSPTGGANPMSLAGAGRISVEAIRMVSETCPR
jgi:hypothetical protein